MVSAYGGLIDVGCFGVINGEYLACGKATIKSLGESGIKSSPSVWRVVLAGELGRLLGRSQVQVNKSWVVTKSLRENPESYLVIQSSFLVVFDVSALALNPAGELSIGIDIGIGFGFDFAQGGIVLDARPKVLNRRGRGLILHDVANDVRDDHGCPLGLKSERSRNG